VCAIVAFLSIGFGAAHAQLVVTDPATTIKNIVIAGLKSQIVETLTDQARKIRRMARRLSVFTDLTKYAVPEPTRWRSYRYQDVNLYANPYVEALNFGDPQGAAYADVTRARSAIESQLAELADLSPEAASAIASQLATLDLADSTIIAGTDQNGRLRPQGKREMRAIDALERDVVDPSQAQSATAVLDKISAAVLIETREKQSRLQFLSAIVEQLLVDNKRARDTEAAVMNMQLRRLLNVPGEGGAGFLSGAGDDLRRWRQP
ncbi:MAG: hypothetical protein HY655_03385, partial [Acidobacteria bacterium]|nr:hypothetical protein [Acidobacteriota bacterium]